MKKSYILCEGGNCPLKESCERYLPNLDKSDIKHIAGVPYDFKKGKCNFYIKDDDLLQQLNLTSNA